jgi:large subunit ribosomal protein L5
MAQAAQRSRLKSRYEQEIRPALIERFQYSTPMQAPVISKITLNMGVGDAKQDTKVLEAATEQLATIAGQRPSVRRARKSIAAFKLREGMPVGVSVTLRGERSYEFLDRLMSVAIPRIRDFRGMNPRSFDGRGNYSLGVREQIIFPEIDYDAIDQTRGLDITITTTAKTDAEAFALLEAFGFPFARPESASGAAPQPAVQPPAPPDDAERQAGEDVLEQAAEELVVDELAQELVAELVVEDLAEELAVEAAAEELGEELVAEELVAEELVAEELVAEELAAEEISAEDSSGGALVAEEPEAGQSASADEPAAGGSLESVPESGSEVEHGGDAAAAAGGDEISSQQPPTDEQAAQPEPDAPKDQE